MKPILAATASSAATDEKLVAAAREGSDEAVEALFRRYHDRITAYARGIVVDPGRAEDIMQETFMSALRNLRATDREIVFKPWNYQIAKNACIDQLRREGRTDEISIDSEDFKPQHEGRLSQGTPTTHRAVSQREDMHQLAQAFSGLPRSQHEVLVLRELEGRSYEEIGRRLDLSRSAVESMLFRARRGLKDEYDEITTGERCRRILALIAAVAEGVGTARDRRAISRHARLCAGCRQEAIFGGLGALVVDGRRRGRLRSAIDKAAALLPFPFLRRRGRGSEASSASVGNRAQSILSNFSSAAGAEQVAQLPKVVAAIVATAVIASGGIVGHNSAGGSGVAAAGSTVPAGLAAPGAPGQAPPGFPGLPTAGGTSGSPGLGALLGSSQGFPSALGFSPSTSAPSVFSPSLVPLSLGGTTGGGNQGGGLLGGLSLPGGSSGSGSGSLIAPDGSVQLPSVGGIQLPGTQSGGGGGSGQTLPLLDSSGSGSTQLPKIDTSKVTSPSLPTPSTGSTPSLPSTDTSTPSVPSVSTTPSVPDAGSTTSSTLNTVTNTVNGVTGATGPSLSDLGL
jgi:RNA polymerase sigma factor (sigma-70 family)